MYKSKTNLARPKRTVSTQQSARRQMRRQHIESESESATQAVNLAEQQKTGAKATYRVGVGECNRGCVNSTEHQETGTTEVLEYERDSVLSA